MWYISHDQNSLNPWFLAIIQAAILFLMYIYLCLQTYSLINRPVLHKYLFISCIDLCYVRGINNLQHLLKKVQTYGTETLAQIGYL